MLLPCQGLASYSLAGVQHSSMPHCLVFNDCCAQHNCQGNPLLLDPPRSPVLAGYKALGGGCALLLLVPLGADQRQLADPALAAAAVSSVSVAVCSPRVSSSHPHGLCFRGAASAWAASCRHAGAAQHTGHSKAKPSDTKSSICHPCRTHAANPQCSDSASNNTLTPSYGRVPHGTRGWCT